MDVGIVYGVGDVGSPLQLVGEYSQLGYGLAAACHHLQAGGEDIVVALFDHHHVLGEAHTGKYILHIGIEFTERTVLIGMGPRATHALAGNPQSEVSLFDVCLAGVFIAPAVLMVVVAVAHLEEAQVGVLAVGIAHDALQATEEQRLAHHAEVGAQRVDHLDGLFPGISVETSLLVVAHLGERVVHNLIEATTHELLANKVLQTILGILLGLHGERRLELGGNLDIVVAVDTQDVLDHVTGALHVGTVGGHVEHEAFGVFSHHLHLQAFGYLAYHVVTDGLAYQTVAVFIVETHLGVGDGGGIDIVDLHGHLAACQLAAEDGGLLEGIDGAVGVDAALEAVRGIGRETVATGALANPGGVEVGTLEHHVGGGVIGT